MAANLGTLTLDLVAKIGGFTGPISEASRESQRRMGEIKKSAEVAGAAIGGLAVIGAGMAVALIKSTTESAQEIQNLSAVAGLSTTEFQKAAAAGATLGIEQGKISDIFKDATEKLGEYVALGSGPLSDFFTNIAPLVGVTADNFKKLNGADALKLYVSSLEKANVSQAEMTFYMEAIASDATLLLPLLQDGAGAFDDLGDAAEDAGAIMSQSTIAAANDLDVALTDLQTQSKGLKTELAAQLMPTVAQFSLDMQQAAKDAGGLGEVAETLTEKMVGAIAFVADAGDGVVRVFDTVAQTLIGIYSVAVGDLKGLSADVAELLSNLPDFAGGEGFARQAAQYRQESEKNLAVAQSAADKIRDNLEKPLAGQQFKDYVKAANAAAEAKGVLVGLEPTPGTGSGSLEALKAIEDAEKAAEKARENAEKAAKKAAEEAARAIEDAKRRAQAIDSQVEAMQLQVRTLGMTSDEEKLFRLEVEGATAAQLDQAAAALESISVFETQQKVQEDYKDLVSELRTEEERRSDTLREQLKILDAMDAMKGLSGAERNKVAGRIADQATEDAPSFGGVDAVVGGPFGELQKIDEAEQKLAEWYQTQLAMLDGFRSERADLAAVWDEQELALKQEHEDELGRIERARQLTQLAAAESMFGDIADITKQFAGEQSAAYKVAFAAQKAAAIAQSLVAIQTGIALAAQGSFPANLAAMATVAAATAGLVSNISSIGIDGQAHDGIMSVPEDGTWNLKKGERVTTAETSAKLDSVLSRIQTEKDSGSFGGGDMPPVNVTNNFPGMTTSREARESSASVQRAIAGAIRNASRYT